MLTKLFTDIDNVNLAKWLQHIVTRYAVIFVVIVTIIGFSAILLHMYYFQQRLVETVALQNASDLSSVLEEFRTQYTNEVVSPAIKSGIKVTHNYKNEVDSIPLPINLTKMKG